MNNNLDDFFLSGEQHYYPHLRLHKPRVNKGAPFLKGPIPVAWLARAARLRGKALAVGLAIWYQSGLCKTQIIKGTHSLWRKFNISRGSSYPALLNLENNGLISVKRHRGRSPIITILVVPDDRRGQDQ